MDAVAQESAAREALSRSLSLSLRSTGDDWYRPTLTRANALAARMYREIFGERIPAATRTAISQYVEDALKATKRDPDSRDAQVARLARGIASYLASAVLDSNTPSDQWEKVWRTVHDDKVRDSHQLADGQVVDGDGYFTVGGVKMFAPGDLSAPAEEWAGCRCHPEYRRRTAMPEQLVAAADIDPGGFVIIGLPAADDPIHEVSSEQPAHLTMLYLSVDFLEQAAQIVAGEAPKHEPTTVEVVETGELGDGGAQVAHVNPLGLADARDALMGYEPIQQGMEAVEQYPQWTPHVTLGYPETPPLSGDVPGTITIDRLAILDGSGALHSEYPLGEAMSETAVEAPAEEVDEFPTSGVYEMVPLYGVLAPEGRPTGDRRGFVAQSLEWIEPPLSLRWQERDHPGHDDSVVTGSMEKIWRDEPTGLIKWEGWGSMNEDANKMVALIAEKALRGISVDLDDATVELRMKDGSELAWTEVEGDIGDGETGPVEQIDMDDVGEWVTYGRIRSAAVCPIPAFPEAFIAIGTWAEHDAQQAAAEQPEEDIPEELVASVIAEAESVLLASGGSVLTFAPGTQDGDVGTLLTWNVQSKGALELRSSEGGAGSITGDGSDTETRSTRAAVSGRLIYSMSDLTTMSAGRGPATSTAKATGGSPLGPAGSGPRTSLSTSDVSGQSPTASSSITPATILASAPEGSASTVAAAIPGTSDQSPTPRTSGAVHLHTVAGEHYAGQVSTTSPILPRGTSGLRMEFKDGHVASVTSLDVESGTVTLSDGTVLAAGRSLKFGPTSNPSTMDGPGWLTHPVDTDRLRDYWVRGKGAAKIGWGMPGDFNRCRAFLAEYIKPMYLAGYCANRHKDALGFWPGEHRPGKASSEVATFTLVASASKYAPPRSWFDDPHFVERAPMTVTDIDPKYGLRRVFGHAAEWDECHTGFADRCVSAPSSPSNYSRYHLGYVVLEDGTSLPTGTLTMGTGHAALSMSAAAAAAHYDNTGTAFAQVRCGEDAIGIWFAGVISPSITDEQIFDIRGAKISGDWRNVAGQGLDAIAMLAVNTPGFPIVRTALAASAGERQALVAAGVVEAELITHETLERIVAAAVTERLSIISARQSLLDAAHARRRATMATIAASAAARKDV